MNIAERIDRLMVAQHINRRQLSIGANIPYTTLDGIAKKGGHNIQLTTLIKLADFFQVSIDYLVGREDYQLTLVDAQELKTFKDYLKWRSYYG